MLVALTQPQAPAASQILNPTGTEALLSMSPGHIALNLAIATAFGIVIAITYRQSHKGLSYSQSFTQTILFIAVIVAIVMMVINGSIARAFALVGALSIIRFRTVVKDTRDTAFVFAALALGMAAGTDNIQLGVIGCAFLVVMTYLMHASNFGALYKSEFILRFSFEQSKDTATYLAAIEEHARRSNLLHVEPSGDGSSLRLTYDIMLEKEKTAEGLTKAMGQVDGASQVVVIVAKNDVDY